MITTTQSPSRTHAYEERIHKLNRQSVNKHFDAYADVDWDAPENRIDPEDPRFERQPGDTLGATDWYRALPQPIRARLGLQLIVCQLKTGLEFERILQRGLLEFTTRLGDGSVEFRYAYHEVIEEAQHSLMFYELIRRAGLETVGMTGIVRWGAERVPRLGRTFPELFFIHVLSGEAPIDYVQRSELADKGSLHPLLRRVMQIHVTEEARHICFAKEYLRANVAALSPWRMFQLRFWTPLVLKDAAATMLEPPKRIVELYQIPDAVLREAYRDNPRHRQKVVEGLASVRELAKSLGIVTPCFSRLWKRLGIWA